MKLIVDKQKNGLTNPEFIKHLKNPVAKSELTQFEADVLKDTLFAALKGLGGIGLSANKVSAASIRFLSEICSVLRNLRGVFSMRTTKTLKPNLNLYEHLAKAQARSGHPLPKRNAHGPKGAPACAPSGECHETNGNMGTQGGHSVKMSVSLL